MRKRSKAGTVRSILICCTALCSLPAHAQTATGAVDLRAEIERLRAETDRKIAELRAETDARIAGLTGLLERGGAVAATTPPQTNPPQSMTAHLPPADIQLRATVDNSAIPAARPATAVGGATSPLQFSGDLRMRYEQNFGESGRHDRSRGVVRGRLRATYAFDKNFSMGARLVTGDPDDPNSADLTLTQFDDDLLVSVDQVFARAKFGGLDLYAGKFDNPFIHTDLVWDGDVNPQGLAAIYSAPVAPGVRLRASALHFIIDESSAGRDSSMDGGQLGIAAKLAPQWDVEFAGAYYGYALPVVVDADPGDFRSNLLRGGRYLSDFRIVDAVGSITFSGLGPKLPIRLVGNYVQNLGAAVSDDTGYGADIFVGRAAQKGDWRFQYGYAEMGVDGVLAAFSHDNTDLATNYLQHTLAVDFVPRSRVVLNATYYRYRLKNPIYTGAIAPGDWANRLRLNFIYAF
jgi:hypothetical protein